MAVCKLTAQAVEALKPPAKGRAELWDEQVRGLGLRVTERGVKSWVVMYRTSGTQRRMTLGHYPNLKLSDARELADETLRAVRKGADPAADKKAARLAPKHVPLTVEQSLDQFIEKYAKPKNRSWQETKRIFDHHIIPAWGRRPVAEITKADVIDILDPIAKRTPYMANRVLACVRRWFNWCLERDAIAFSPAANIKAPGVEISRDRVLSDTEIKDIWEACEDMGWPFGLAFKMLMLTGQRRDEVSRMRWQDVDIEKALWTLPREQTKSDRLHEVPLSSLAIEILESVPRTGDFVFTTTGSTPISGFSKAKRQVDKQSGVEGWRLHDLRRTVASGMARIGVAPHVIEKALNHSGGQISGVAAIYNRHGYTDEKRGALEAWASKVCSVIQEKHDMKKLAVVP